MALHAFLWPFHAQLSATRLACIPLSSSLQRLGCMKISAVQEYSEASGFVRDSLGMMVHVVPHEGSVGGIGRRKAEARIVPLSACRTSRYPATKPKSIVSTNLESVSMSRYASNKAKKLLEERSGCIKSRFAYVWIKSLKK